jgi:hypothetical protein
LTVLGRIYYDTVIRVYDEAGNTNGYGPNERTGRNVDVSLGLAEYLDLKTDQIVSVIFV